jgi:hypothetical protein
MPALNSQHDPRDIDYLLERLETKAVRVSDLGLNVQTSGPLSPRMFEKISQMREQVTTIEQQSALYRLEATAIRLRGLEDQCECILSMVGLEGLQDEDEPFEIPACLRRPI